jgi:hypothetical protein
MQLSDNLLAGGSFNEPFSRRCFCFRRLPRFTGCSPVSSPVPDLEQKGPSCLLISAITMYVISLHTIVILGKSVGMVNW